MNSIIKDIRAELKSNSDISIKNSSKRFFKEEVKAYGIKSSTVSVIAKKYWKIIQEEKLSKKQIFEICEELLKSDYCEEAFIVSNWCPRLKADFEEKDLKLFKVWIDKYINNWAKCDSFCNHTIGDFITKFPQASTIKEIKSWGKSNNRWMKRASAVSFIIPARKGEYLKDALEIADTLLLTKDDMVQKGYGWLLKEASRKHEKEVFNYVIKNKQVMPRTALRYAIELMPKDLKEKAMKK
ncbi:MAG: DNA alkylation repair protein [archaeon]